MSSTSFTPARDVSLTDTATDDLPALFEFIYSSNRVCSNCFTLLREVEVPPVWYHYYHKQSVVPEGFVDHTHAVERVVPDRAARKPPIKCADCEVCSPFDQERPVSKRRAITLARNLADTAEFLQQEAHEHASEGAVPAMKPWLLNHDRDRLLACVGRLKENPRRAMLDLDDRLWRIAWRFAREF